MKKIILYSIVLLAVPLLWIGCKKSNYPGGVVSPYIPLFDLRSLYKGSDVTLGPDNMFGGNSISVVVISDHSGKNLPSGLLIVQDRRRLNELRGIQIPLGSEANKYVSGDSILINVEGAILKRVDGNLQITNVNPGAIKKVASNVKIVPNAVSSSVIFANPDKYESTLLSIVKGTYNPQLLPTDVISGDKMLNDGFDDIKLHTEASASFAGKIPPVMGNYLAIMMNKVSADGNVVPELRLRTDKDIFTLSSTIEIPAFIISGWIADPKGTDANNEYIQFLATRDINFAVTPFSVVTTNNAGASTPIGNPTNGWATGGLRTYKFNLTFGTVSKGQFFYVGGGNKLINSTGSTSIASSKWIRSFNYSTADGDGFGTKTTNLLANSGNAYGVAAFEGTSVTADSRPIDVLFISSGGSLFSAGPPAVGYRIGNTDLYDVIEPLTQVAQPFYRQGNNTKFFAYHPDASTISDQGYYYKFGGIYSVTLGKWIKARTVTHFLLTKTSQLNEIEGIFPEASATNPDGVPATTLK